MSKLSNILTMLFELQKGGMKSIQDLANLLEVTPRQIRRYRDDLEMSGIFIQSKTGKYGGYYLDDIDKAIPIQPISSEKDKLFSSLFKDETSLSIKQVADIHQFYLEQTSMNEYIKKSDDLALIRKNLILTFAIAKQMVVEVNYLTTKTNTVIVRKLKPYFVFEKFGMKYLAALEMHNANIKYYKLSKIINISFEGSKFEMEQDFLQNEEETVKKNQGVFYKTKLFKLIIAADKTMKSVINDTFDNALIDEAAENQIKATIMVGSEEEMFYRLLVFGSRIKVIEPKTIANKLKIEFKKAYDNYE